MNIRIITINLIVVLAVFSFLDKGDIFFSKSVYAVTVNSLISIEDDKDNNKDILQSLFENNYGTYNIEKKSIVHKDKSIDTLIASLIGLDPFQLVNP
ncbi:MAG: hypothetical protein MRJ93_05095 [Nitrososphaeraceae archaeon]|nr:hypothetical protein [Nitrososphaeraceae archaeon]